MVLFYETVGKMTSSFSNVTDVTADDEPVTATDSFTWLHRYDDGRPYLHAHWLRHRDVIESAPDWFIYVLGVYISIVGVVSITGNATVVGVFVR